MSTSKKAAKGHHTQWAGQFGVAHELTRRGHLVAFTMGNAPKADLLCVSPSGKSFQVQVKSISSQTSFICQKLLLEPTPGLFFVLALVPCSDTVSGEIPLKPAEYFILNQQQLRQVTEEQERVNKATGQKRGRPLKEFAPGVCYSVLKRLDTEHHFGNAWENLPA